METRANHVWVGAITLLLLALLAAFFVWLVQLGGAAQKEYDIFFPQSVGGLAKGSSVTFQGVDAGQVDKIELWPKDPSFVRVRVSLDEGIPILQGTTASISAGESPAGRAVLETIVRSRASRGWSHSNVTPTTSSPAPIANRISVVDGSSETIRTTSP